VIKSLEPYTRSILRIMAGFIQIEYGFNHLFAVPVGPGGPRPAAGIGTLLWYAGLLDTIGGALMILGLLTAPVAFILCGEMAYAFFFSHVPRGSILPFTNGGVPAVLLCFIYLHVITADGGPWSLDRWIAKWHQATQ
jgi:putative oxidoreductase